MDAKFLEAIEAGRIDEAVATAVSWQPDALLETLEYRRISNDAQPYWEFAQAWIAAAGSLDKPIIA